MTPSSLDGYRVVYRIEDHAPGAKPEVTTETIEVRRPYDGRVTDGQGSRVVSGRVTSRAYFWQLGDGGALRFGVLRQPGGPARDASLVALRDAARARRVISKGSDRVLGRDCAWFAYRDPAPASLAPPTRSSTIESCVDGAGIVLREVWTLHGRKARIVRATSVVASPPTASVFLEGRTPANTKVTEPKGAELVGTLTQAQDVAPGRVRPLFALTVPNGWRSDRTTVVAAALQGAQPTQFLAQAFLRGTSLAIVETASSPNLPPPWPTAQGVSTKIGEGEGRVVYYMDRVEVRLLSAAGYARVVAPSVAVAMEFIRGLSAR